MRSRSLQACLLAVVSACVLTPRPGAAQVATVAVAENFRAEPNGAILSRLVPGTSLSVARSRGAWAEAELVGWVWAASVQATDRGGYRLVVAADGGENLRQEPQGRIVARLMEGMLLNELDRRPGWLRVRRVGWIWGASIDLADPRSQIASSGPSAPPPASRNPEPDDDVGGTGVVTVPERGLPILMSPDGDTLARPVPGADLQVLGREGAWARVRVEGWTWMGSEALDSSISAIATPLEVGPSVVTGEPDRYRGRVVKWVLQFVSLERAERVRTDFYEGEPFLLTRPSGDPGGFVYVAVPPERLSEVGSLTPLERIEVVGRIRAGSSRLTGSPILDLIELRGGLAR